MTKRASSKSAPEAGSLQGSPQGSAQDGEAPQVASGEIATGAAKPVPQAGSEGTRFWEEKTLGQMSRAEWESLCDGCGRCCLHKLRYEPDARIAWTNVACRLLETQSCRCRHYKERRDYVPDCVQLTPAKLAKIDWLPPSCAYRLLAEGKPLYWWHPLVSGDTDSVHQAGISVRGRAIDERRAGPLEHHLSDWPGIVPRRKRPST